MNRKLLRIILSSVLLLGAWLVERYLQLPMWQLLLVYLVPYLLVGYGVLAEAWEGISEGDPFDENLLMSIATIGALLIGFLPGAEPQFVEAVFVMLFFEVGELFEDYAEDKSRDNIAELMDIRPDVANVERNGAVEPVAPQTVGVGETIIVKPGEKIPLDGVVLDGRSSLNTVALTGESLPRSVAPGDEVISGCINLSGLLKVQVTKSFGESTVSKIINLVENAGANKSRSESFITRFARIYTPIVVFLALALAFLPPFFAASYAAAFPTWLYRALTFLVVSCPCALVISIPLTFFGGIGGASRHGILIKGGNYMDTLAKAGIVVFDKTGTLTKGTFAVEAVHPDKMAAKELLHLAAHVERYSTHPIAAALRQAYPDEADDCRIDHVTELAGKGVTAVVNGRTVSVGNEQLMEEVGADRSDCPLCAQQTGTTIHVAVDGMYAGHVIISDQLKPDARQAVADLKALGVNRTVMLTGDREAVAESIARELSIDEFHAALLPADKVNRVESLLQQKAKDTTLAFVGDGINDAPVLARADVGIAMGALGSDAAIEAADVVLMDDKPSKLVTAVEIARRTLRIAAQNAWFAITVKVAVLILAGLGLATMGMAVFADVGVMVLAVLNAMRALRV
ncbi:heavy metal translocating P-type ATPase [Prevotella sp. kh1p2]|uniref:heavy metal translocating P-type ATPase n=1 Tax=Prevotella sp. kh1p2 TaxID=1761883 RepID=UPI0008BFEE84|nr:heavy metal translocating P-type ATPase [Prevotella sp. kh1p2]SET24023.1 Cd2+/Zn2+-exporting ATPase [Prevotella sp. kh1p2]